MPADICFVIKPIAGGYEAICPVLKLTATDKIRDQALSAVRQQALALLKRWTTEIADDVPIDEALEADLDELIDLSPTDYFADPLAPKAPPKKRGRPKAPAAQPILHRKIVAPPMPPSPSPTGLTTGVVPEGFRVIASYPAYAINQAGQVLAYQKRNPKMLKPYSPPKGDNKYYSLTIARCQLTSVPMRRLLKEAWGEEAQ